MYMLKQHTLDLKTDKGLFNSSQIITIAGSQRWLNLRAELKTSCTTIELRAAVLFQNVSDCNSGQETNCFAVFRLLLEKPIYSDEYCFYFRSFVG